MPEVVCKDTVISARGRRVFEHNNDTLAAQLMDTLDISELRAYNLIHEMKLYLLLCTLHPGENIAVPPKLDIGLHPFFDSEEFKAFCKDCLEGTIEHTPHDGPMTPQDRERTLERARAGYSTHFDRLLWSDGLPVCTCRYVPN